MKISKFVFVFIFLSFHCPISLSGPMPGMSINSGIYWRETETEMGDASN